VLLGVGDKYFAAGNISEKKFVRRTNYGSVTDLGLAMISSNFGSYSRFVNLS